LSEENIIIVFFCCIVGEFKGCWVNIYGHVPRTQREKKFSFKVGPEEGLDPNLHTKYDYIAAPTKVWQLGLM
jgi:hypothetical protein